MKAIQRIAPRLAAVTFLAAFAAVVGLATPAEPTDAIDAGSDTDLTALFIEAQPGSELDGSWQQLYMEEGSDWTFTARVPSQLSKVIELRAQSTTDSQNGWRLLIGGPDRTLITGGDFLAVSSDTTNGRASLSIFGPHTACYDQSVGRMTVHQLVMAGPSVVTRLAVSFELHCSGQVAAIMGAIHYHSTAIPFAAMKLEVESVAFAGPGATQTI